MAKIREQAGTSKREVDVFGRLERLASEFDKAAEPKKESEAALSSFLFELTDEEEQEIRRKWSKLSRSRQNELMDLFNALGGGDGPADKLMRGIYEDGLAFQDSLPAAPPVVNQQVIDVSVAALIGGGIPEEKAREIVESFQPNDEELLRGELLADGCTPEVAEAAIAQYRRQGKWVAASNAAASAETAANAQARDKEMRRLAPQIAKQADRAARALTTLSVAPQEAPAIQDGVFTTLASVVNEALLAGAPFHWDDAVLRARELVDAVAKGSSPDASGLAQAARDLAALAREAKTLAAGLARGRGRPSKPAVDGAEALKGQGLTWSQTAVVLDEKGLNLEPHTPENIRKSVLARRRKHTPAKK